MTSGRPVQRRTLVRAKNLASFRRALVDLAIGGPPLAACRRVVVVPTRASAELLRQTIERGAADAGRAAVIVPELLTRDDLLARLQAAVPDAGGLVTRIEREVLFGRAAADTIQRRSAATPPFDVRPGLIGAMLDFYDALRRRQRSVRRFARVLFDELRGERGADRGSEGLIRQTAFLGYTFLAYERALRANGRIDEHLLRRILLDRDPPLPFDHLVVAVADHPSDPRGLWPADFDLIGRLSHLSRLDVVMTDEAHDAGFRERLEQELPDIAEARAPDEPTSPRIVVPGGGHDGLVFVARDREEELRDVVRVIRAQAAGPDAATTARAAIVFQRPLPYLYLAQQVLGEARVPYQTFDTLPLAAEPQAALLDLALTVARAGGTREAVIGLLRSPHLSIAVDGMAPNPGDVSALDALLVFGRVTGDASTYRAEVERYAADPLRRREVSISGARRAAAAAAGVANALEGFRSGPSAFAQISTLASFLRQYGRPSTDDSDAGARLRRGRAAILATLDAFAIACRAFDDAPRAVDRLAAEIHHAIEAQTFAPRRGEAGVHLTDAVSARFGEFDYLFAVGLVETEWPERIRGNIFYGSGLLSNLGWPREPDHLRAEYAAFRDLLDLARAGIRLSAFQLEGDSIVGLSPMPEAARDMARAEAGPVADVPTFSEELVAGGSMPSGLDAEPAAWLGLRLERPPTSDADYSGFVDPQAPQPYRVSQVDQYVTCPFKYFARSVLQLKEEADDASGLSPLERGTLLHALFERFYTRWHAEGRGAVTMESLPDALAVFAEIARDAFQTLSPADRALEETRMLGSIVGRGVAERVFELEADAGVGVTDRLLEKDIRGTFTFPLLGGLSQRTVEIRGKADRIDVLEDGTLRVVDYKLGKLPDLDHSVQLAVYAHAIRQMLATDGRGAYDVSSAMYLAFGDDRRLEGELGKRGPETAMAVEHLAAEFAGHITAIEGGRFPAQPLKPSECAWCAYAGVCRKEYFTSDDSTDAL